MAVIKKGNIACKIGAKYLIDKDGGKNTIPYNEAAAKSIIISVTLDPDMLCTVFDNDNKVYNMLLSVPSLSEGYIDNLPFFESLTIDSKDAIALNSNKVQFRPLAYANEIRNQFLEDHRKAFAGDLKKLFKVICIDIMCYVVVMSWVGYAIITYRVGYSVLEVIYKPFANSTKGGIDLLKIFTLGIYNMEAEPSFPILFGGNLLLVFLVYVIFTYF